MTGLVQRCSEVFRGVQRCSEVFRFSPSQFVQCVCVLYVFYVICVVFSVTSLNPLFGMCAGMCSVCVLYVFYVFCCVVFSVTSF